MGGIQSHNQREHESRKNKEIDYSKSNQNYDLFLDENTNYQRAVKERIAELGLKKAVRKDAVVYCSFIVSSDKDFFERLGYDEHFRRQSAERESVLVGVEEPVPFEYMNESYKADCMKEGAERFFDNAFRFFYKRYGIENVINATVHMDEATPHMHLGIVPVTKDGRLSAKDIFTPLELKRLQTDFARDVGKRFNLERGKEGSEAKHLDEISFKLKHRTEQVEELSNTVHSLENRRYELESSCRDLEKRRENLNKTISNLGTAKDTLEREITALEGRLDAVEGDRRNAMERFVELPQVKPIFDRFFKEMLENIAKRQQQQKKRKNRDRER
jgi:exonuclease VII small subunit